MIGYEDASVRDCRLYFNDAICWHWNGSCIVPYVWDFEDDREEDEPDDDGAAYGHCFTLHPLDGNAPSLHVLGEALFTQPHYIVHRFPIEYVPLSASRLMRCATEPTRSSVTKGLSLGMVHVLPTVSTSTEWIASKCFQACTSWDTLSFVQGVARVLSIGIPACMRRLISAQQARANARRAVLEMFRGEDVVVVPDFSVALVRHRTHSDHAYVLRRGRVVGSASAVGEGEILFTGDLSATGKGTKAERRVAQEGITQMATRLFADSVAWS